MSNKAELEVVDAELSALERRRAWMAQIITALRAKKCRTQVAERQEAKLAEMLGAMRSLRARIEELIIEERKPMPIPTVIPANAAQEMHDRVGRNH